MKKILGILTASAALATYLMLATYNDIGCSIIN